MTERRGQSTASDRMRCFFRVCDKKVIHVTIQVTICRYTDPRTRREKMAARQPSNGRRGTETHIETRVRDAGAYTAIHSAFPPRKGRKAPRNSPPRIPRTIPQDPRKPPQKPRNSPPRIPGRKAPKRPTNSTRSPAGGHAGTPVQGAEARRRLLCHRRAGRGAVSDGEGLKGLRHRFKVVDTGANIGYNTINAFDTKGGKYP